MLVLTDTDPSRNAAPAALGEGPNPAGDDPVPAPPDTAWKTEARRLVGELFVRKPAVYWIDTVASAIGAWLLTAVVFLAPAGSVVQILAFVFAGVLFFRVGTFIHEIVHMPTGQMTGYKRAWNLLVGIPLLMPWVIYRNHIEHHNHKKFGTPEDGEYLPLASSPIVETLKYLAQAPLLPLVMILRFGVVGPVSWFVPKLRHWVLHRASAAVSNPYFTKRFPERDERHLVMVEMACFVWLVFIGALVARGTIGWGQVALGYALLAWALGLNWVRNLVAHRYGNAGEVLTHDQQVADSINITGQTWLTVLLFPVGLRYHALHHLFPALPYHSMGEAHRRLMAGLPADAPYRQTNVTSFAAGVRDLWRSARATSREASSMRAWSPRSR